MRSGLFKRIAKGVAMLSTLFVVGSAWAAPIAEKSKLVCASVDVIACSDKAECVEGRASSFDLPQFMFVDLDKKLVRAENVEGDSNVSKIKTIEFFPGQIILQGVENERAWSASIDRNSRRLLVSSVGADVSFTLFGECTAL